MLAIRAEKKSDAAAIHEVNRLAFGQVAEANLVDLLRAKYDGLISLVAEEGGRVVGHALWSPVTIEGSSLKGMGLGPLAVLPEYQKKGIGTSLAEAGLDACRKNGYDFALVLGHPDYYPRFGFVPASKFNLKCEYEVPDEAFMVMELRHGALQGVSGVVRYLPEFKGV